MDSALLVTLRLELWNGELGVGDSWDIVRHDETVFGEEDLYTSFVYCRQQELEECASRSAVVGMSEYTQVSDQLFTQI